MKGGGRHQSHSKRQDTLTPNRYSQICTSLDPSRDPAHPRLVLAYPLSRHDASIQSSANAMGLLLRESTDGTTPPRDYPLPEAGNCFLVYNKISPSNSLAVVQHEVNKVNKLLAKISMQRPNIDLLTINTDIGSHRTLWLKIGGRRAHLGYCLGLRLFS